MKLSVTEPEIAPAVLVSMPTLRSAASVAPGARPVTAPLTVAPPPALSATSRLAAPAAAVLVTLTCWLTGVPTCTAGKMIVEGVLTRGAAAATMLSTIFSVSGVSACE